MGEPTKKTVLVVDDERTVRDLLHRLNTTLGFNTIEAPDGQAGLELFEAKHPDLVITDVYMPRMTGLQLLINIRRLNAAVPVILITAHSHFRQLVADDRIRPDGYFEKPFQIFELAEKIKTILNPPPDLD